MEKFVTSFFFTIHASFIFLVHSYRKNCQMMENNAYASTIERMQNMDNMKIIKILRS